MNEKFSDFVHKFSGARLAVAVSGGVDSVCLLHWLHQMNMNITALHVNHHLRTAADVEEQYVVETCEKLGIPCCVFHWTDE